MGLDIEAGTEAKNRPGILRNVWLEKRDSHSAWAHWFV
jgi:hypothetical protein